MISQKLVNNSPISPHSWQSPSDAGLHKVFILSTLQPGQDVIGGPILTPRFNNGHTRTSP